jgi:glyoxylase-like metal-dependent hydrolase (beta-lactamase superfamily II)
MTCGTQYPPRAGARSACPICLDERQYVGWSGQRWIDSAELASTSEIRFEDCSGVMTMFLEPSFAISQRAFLIPQDGGLLMWECLSAVTGAALERIAGMGGVKAIAISHPHFYASMNQWSAAMGGVPIYLHEADREWVQFETAAVRFWSGDRLALSDNLELVHLPGHFEGGAGLWWKDGPRPGGSLFPGDAIQVAMDRRFATFMYSYPNAIPLGRGALARLEAHAKRLRFEDVYGFSRGRQIIGDAKAKVDASFARYRAALAA